MKIVEEPYWKNPGHPAMFVFAVGKFDGTLYKYRITSEAIGRIQNFKERALTALKSDKGFVIGAEPSEGKSGWGILRVGYVDYPNLAAIATAVLDLDECAKAHPDWKFRMTFPGLEHIHQDMVEPVIGILPDNVTAVVYEKVPRPTASNMNIHDVYFYVRNQLIYGQNEMARLFLEDLGFDDPEGQVAAVRELEREEIWTRSRKSRSPTG
jgi:hypothetical protein